MYRRLGIIVFVLQEIITLVSIERITEKFGKGKDFPEDVSGFIQTTFSSFKKKVNRNPKLWELMEN